jgi:hypothetical protein
MDIKPAHILQALSDRHAETKHHFAYGGDIKSRRR